MRHFLACGLVASLALPTSAQHSETHDFRFSKFDDVVMSYSGQTPDKYITPEKEGLRLRYTGVNAPPPKNTAGVAWRFQARGDFVVTGRYEILHVVQPDSGNGVGVELYVRLKNKSKDGVALARLAVPEAEPLIAFNYMTNDAAGRRVVKDPVRSQTTDASLRGRLRLARTGRILTAFFAEADGPFVKVQESEIGNADIDLIRFAGLAGGTNAVLDLRLLEFSLAGADLGYKGKFGTAPPAPEAPAINPGAPIVKIDNDPAALVHVAPRTNVVLLAVIAALVLAPLILIIAAVVFLRLRKPAAEPRSKKRKTPNPQSREA